MASLRNTRLDEVRMVVFIEILFDSADTHFRANGASINGWWWAIDAIDGDDVITGCAFLLCVKRNVMV